MQINPDILACPVSHQPLIKESSTLLRTADGQYTYKQVDGIWHFLTPGREKYFQQFLREYEAVRKAEGRKETESSYYRALPYSDLSDKRPEDWQIRAASLDALITDVIETLEKKTPSATMLDLGAGNGWLSYRLAKRGHAVSAVDLLTNDWDGLGTHKYYDVKYIPLQAEFDHLPIRDQKFDVVIFNASLHYSDDFSVTLAEALRCIKPDGKIAVLDTPIYHDANSGRQMVQEREAAFQQSYGFPSNVIKSENYLTYSRLGQLGEQLGIKWQRITPDYGWRWKMRPLMAALRGSREPAQFELLIGNQTK